MGFPLPKKTNLLPSALHICVNHDWSQENIKKIAQDNWADPMQVTLRVLKDAFQQKIPYSQKLKNIDVLLQCMYRGDYLFDSDYHPAQLFNSLFGNPKSANKNYPWREDLSPIEQHTVASFFSFGLQKSAEDFAWGFKGLLPETELYHHYRSLILFLNKNYFPLSSVTQSTTFDRQKICAKILKTEFAHNLTPDNQDVFSDDFCPDLASKRLEKRKNQKIGFLYYEANDESAVLTTLKGMIPTEFKTGAEILSYAKENRKFQPGLFFGKIKSETALKQALDFLSLDPQATTTYKIWSRSQNNLALQITIDDLKDCFLSKMIDELIDYQAVGDCRNLKDPKTRMDVKKEYLKKIYYSLSEKERPIFIDQVVREYSQNDMKKEGIELLDSLHFWWNPKYIDQAIRRLKS